MDKYFIADNYGNGLQYTQGKIYWGSTRDLNNLEYFLSFDTSEKAKRYIEELLQPLLPKFQFRIGKITFKLEYL